MKNLLVGLLVTGFSISSNAAINYALGEMGSGGGNALVCFKSVSEANGEVVRKRDLVREVKDNGNVISDELIKYISSIELFDLYEAKKRRGLGSEFPKIIKIKNNESGFEYVKRVAKRFKNHVPYLEEIISVSRDMLPEYNFLLEDSPVKYQNDLGSVVIPNDHCVISTMAVQVNYNKFYKVHVDGRLFNHPAHSELSKAVLILHESIYAFARAKGQKDSGTTRELVKLFITKSKNITEGFAVKALYHLDFGRSEGEDWPSEFAGIYNESKVVSDLFGVVSNYIHGINSIAFEFYRIHYNEFNSFRTDVNKAIVDYGLNDCSEVKGMMNVDEVYTSANCVYKNHKTPNPDYFFMIVKQIETRYRYFVKMLELNYSSSKTEIINKLKASSNITADDLLRFENNFEMVSMDFMGNIKQPGDFSTYLNRIKNSSEVIKDIYEFQFGNICIVSSDIDDVIIIPVKKSEKIGRCVDPLRLNNIIPAI